MPALARRRLFGLAAAAFTCPLCNRAMAAVEFGYSGAEGPEHWGELSPDYRACGIGTQQSPIDLTGTVTVRLEHLPIDYKKVPLRVWNNGEYILTNMPPGGTVKVGGVTYKLLQFHFHHPSEHHVDGKVFAMEAHFVNQAADGSLCAVGVFIMPGRANSVLGPIVKATPSQPGPDTPVPGVTVDPMGLFPADRSYLPLHGVGDHPALFRDGNLAGVPDPDRGLVGSDRALCCGVSDGRAAPTADEPPRDPRVRRTLIEDTDRAARLCVSVAPNAQSWPCLRGS